MKRKEPEKVQVEPRHADGEEVVTNEGVGRELGRGRGGVLKTKHVVCTEADKKKFFKTALVALIEWVGSTVGSPLADKTRAALMERMDRIAWDAAQQPVLDPIIGVEEINVAFKAWIENGIPLCFQRAIALILWSGNLMCSPNLWIATSGGAQRVIFGLSNVLVNLDVQCISANACKQWYRGLGCKTNPHDGDFKLPPLPLPVEAPLPQFLGDDGGGGDDEDAEEMEPSGGGACWSDDGGDGRFAHGSGGEPRTPDAPPSPQVPVVSDSPVSSKEEVKFGFNPCLPLVQDYGEAPLGGDVAFEVDYDPQFAFGGGPDAGSAESRFLPPSPRSDDDHFGEALGDLGLVYLN